MPRSRRRRSFGTIRQLPSGRYQASYIPPGGTEASRINAPDTFAAIRDAEAWLAAQQTDIARGDWRKPEPPRPLPGTLAAYSADWLATRKLTPRTRQEYRKILDGHVLPAFGALTLDAIKPPTIRAWHAQLDTGPTRKAHAYALLRAILNTAVADDMIDANPCRVRGAGAAARARDIRPATPAELEMIADAMRAAYRAAVLIAAWCGLRFGELAELRRSDLDLDGGWLQVRRAVTHADGATVIGDPKAASRRDVAIPGSLVSELRAHLAAGYAQPGPSGLLFPSPQGRQLRTNGALHRDFKAAAAAAGRPDLTVHGLRHTGAVLAAQAGATTAELMRRLGHKTSDAAMRYQHAADPRDVAIAAVLDGFRQSKVVELRPRHDPKAGAQ